MFPTFSGTSRRPRNVNLSGQKNTNPFAATSWTPSASSNASKTVADAQAERRKREQEREKLKAAQSIQRTWRGHRVRQSLKDSRRAAFDQLYRDESVQDRFDRSLRALPLLLAIFDPRRADDCRRFGAFAEDLVQTDFQLIRPGQLDDAQLRRLGDRLVAALQRTGSDELSSSFLTTLLEIITTRVEAVRDSLDIFYETVARNCHGTGRSEDNNLWMLQRAILAPVQSGSEPKAFKAFAFSFLTHCDLVFFEEHITVFAGHMDTRQLSAAIIEGYSTGAATTRSKDDLLWLLAHFIALERAKGGMSQNPLYLNALYAQLSALHGELRDRPVTQVAGDVDTDDQLPPFVAKAISSLVDKDEISDLLEKFTANYAVSSSQGDEASLLAAYILTLIRCFPMLGDEMRMRLYLTDIASPTGNLPSVKFFWTAMSRTALFSRILSDDRATLNVLRRKDSRTAAVAKDEALWDREWRTILLFLELYIFVLRLTDDEDFFAGFSSVPLDNSTSRLRSCSLPLKDLKDLTVFLRNLAFTLYYNGNDLLREGSASDHSTATLDTLFSSSAGGEPSRTVATPIAQKPATFDIVSGFDFNSFRNMVSIGVHMLYERDSRRPFLPKDHWLMTSRFDMEGFLSAVVLEEQRQHELAEAESDEEVDDDTEMEDAEREFLTVEGQRRSHYAKMEKFRERQRKAQRERMLAAIGPKLEILRNMPFVIPFDTRVKIFRQFVYLDKDRRRGGNIDPDNWRMAILNEHGGPFNPTARGRDAIGRHHAKIRRGKVFSDAFEQFYDLGEGLKEPIQITFVDQFDAQEAGIDGGGVTKEFLTSVTKEAFTDELSLFVANSRNALYPNPAALDQRQDKLRQAGLNPDSQEWREYITELLNQYEFLGRIIGKCMYEGILIDVVFAGFFLLKWASAASDTGYRANINDLKELDEELYQGMLSLKNYPGDIADLGADFTIEDQISMPGEPVRTITRNLIPNGDQVPVTNENRPLYISYMARHRLIAQPFAVTKAFLKGLGSIITPSWLSMFNQSELQRLVGGDSSEIDVEDLRRNTVYSGLYVIGDDGEEHPTIRMFWEVMHSLKDEERRDVLKYVTSTPRAPLLGFGQLSPRFSIRDGGDDQDRLPSASTCVNLLKLPKYKSAAQLKNKLLYAVKSNAGFDLS